jgi:hypothetical protein
MGIAFCSSGERTRPAMAIDDERWSHPAMLAWGLLASLFSVAAWAPPSPASAAFHAMEILGSALASLALRRRRSAKAR